MGVAPSALAAAVSMPMTSPEELINGPPELPGSIRASIWIRPTGTRSYRIWSLAVIVLPTAVTAPAVTVDGKPWPPALPIATTELPIFTVEELPEFHRRQAPHTASLAGPPRRLGVSADNGRPVGARGSRSRHRWSWSPVDYMVVGDDLPVGGCDHAGPLAEVRVYVDDGRIDGSGDLGRRERVPGRRGGQPCRSCPSSAGTRRRSPHRRRHRSERVPQRQPLQPCGFASDGRARLSHSWAAGRRPGGWLAGPGPAAGRDRRSRGRGPAAGRDRRSRGRGPAAGRDRRSRVAVAAG